MVICLGPVCFSPWQIIAVGIIFLRLLAAKLYSLLKRTKSTSTTSSSTSTKKEDTPVPLLVEVKPTPINDIMDYNTLIHKTNNPRYVLLKYSARWCGPCKRVEPLARQLVGRFNDICTYAEIDVDNMGPTLLDVPLGLPSFRLFDRQDRGKKLLESLGTDLTLIERKLTELSKDQ